MIQFLYLLPLELLAVSAVLALVIPTQRGARIWAWLVVVACALSVCCAAWALASNKQLSSALPGLGECFQMDALAAIFTALIGVVAGAGTIYSLEYWSEGHHPRSARSGRFWWSAMVLGMLGVVLARHGVVFLMAWETFAVAGYFLITLNASRREVRAAGWLYLVASHVGTLLLFGFFALLAGASGSWMLGSQIDKGDLAPLFWLALVSFGIKAGMLPLHFWLPSAHANAPSHVSALLSGVALKMGIYGIVRFSGWLPMPQGAGWVVAALGGASALFGVAFALGQHDLKRLLAYHSVENIGIILLGLGFALLAGDAVVTRTYCLAGALLHVWNHGLFKSLLFLGAGSVLHATGTREMSQLGGLWQMMPWTSGLFALGAVAIVGLPPLNGFVSEWLIYSGLFAGVTGGWGSAWAAASGAMVLAVTGALALACFSKVCGVVFLGAPRSMAASRAHECGVAMRGAMLVPAILCAATGMFSGFLWNPLLMAVAAWRGCEQVTLVGAGGGTATLGVYAPVFVAAGVLAALLLWRFVGDVRRGPTWDCGYQSPSPRMQYTAGSFAEILVRALSPILQSETHSEHATGYFPKRAKHSRHTPEVVFEKILEPLARGTLWLSRVIRFIQHGNTQIYLLYLLLGVGALAVMSLFLRS